MQASGVIQRGAGPVVAVNFRSRCYETELDVTAE